MHKRLLSFLIDSRFNLFLTIFAGFLLGLLTIWQAFTLSMVIDSVFLGGKTLADVFPLLQILLLVILLRSLLAWASDVTANAVAVRIKTELRERLFAHILKLGPAYVKGERTGELTATATEGIEALDAYYSQYVPQLVISVLVPVSILLFVFRIDLLSAIVLLVTAPLIPFFMIMIGKAAEALTKRQYETLRRLSAHFLDSLQGLTTLKQLGRSKSHAKTIEVVSNNFRDVTLNVLRVTFLSAFVLEMITTISTAVVAVEIGIRLLYAKMEFQQALFLLVIAPEFYIPLRMLGLRFHAGMSGSTAARRIFQILDIPVDDEQLSVNSDQATAEGDRETIRFEDVSYTYPNETQPALEKINLEIRRGQHVALVGASGAGKSTLASLLLGFIKPTSGNLITDYSSLITVLSWVPQKPHLFHDTIAANIKLAQPDAGMEQVIAAAQAAHLHEFIASLPQGYETPVGEGGARLSGGQAQRLALARAFLKDAPILILDEPTSSLDPEQESLLEDSVRRLMAGRTVITIAHRLNTIFKADQIIVLEGGQIVERGTHTELLSKTGKYTELVKAYLGNQEPISDVELDSGQEEWLMENARPVNPASPIQPLTLNLQPKSVQRSNVPTFQRLLNFLAGSWKWVAASVALGALTIGASIGLMGTAAYLISAAALHPSIAELQVAIVGVRFFGIARGVFRYLERLASHSVTFRLLARLRAWFYTALEPLAPARLMTYKSGDLLSRIVSDIEALENFYVRVVSPPLVAIVVTVLTGWFLGSFHPSLGLALVGFLLALGLIAPLAARIVSRKPSKLLVQCRAEMNAQLVDGIQGMADVIAFGRADDHRIQLRATAADYGKAQRNMAFIAGFNSGLGVLLTNLGMWVILFLAIPLVTENVISGVGLASLALITLSSFEAVTPLPLAAQMFGASHEAAKRLFEVVDARPQIVDRSPTTSHLPHPTEVGITFQNLTFSYSESDSAALQDVSFSLEAGKSLAIVGPSGAGKSTIVNLLERFWDFGNGEIRLGSESIKNFSEDEVRALFAIVSQNSYFFNATLKQNLQLARSKATQEDIESAARQAQIHEFVANLPLGYETWIGEQGARLSGGERQRLAIARALLKDAPVLVLDEPTANLDPLTERAVLETLHGIMKGRTTLMITHRLVGLEHFDEIIVLDHGQIVERGTHAELMTRNGLYRRLFNIQNRSVIDVP